MFSIHPGLRGRLWPVLIFGGLIMLLGLFVMGLSLKSDLKTHRSRVRIGGVRTTTSSRYDGSRRHDATTGERVLIFIIGGIFASVSAYFVYSSASWLRQASDVIRRTRPLPVLLSTRIERIPTRKGDRIEYFASIRPQEGVEAPFDVINDFPVFMGVTSQRTCLPVYADFLADAYVSRSTTDPIVYRAEGKYWCSSKGFRFTLKRPAGGRMMGG